MRGYLVEGTAWVKSWGISLTRLGMQYEVSEMGGDVGGEKQSTRSHMWGLRLKETCYL